MSRVRTEDKIKALDAIALDVQETIEHLSTLCKDQADKKGRYESSGGTPLPGYLVEKFSEKMANLTLGHQLVTDAIRKMREAQTASGSAEREPD